MAKRRTDHNRHGRPDVYGDAPFYWLDSTECNSNTELLKSDDEDDDGYSDEIFGYNWRNPVRELVVYIFSEKQYVYCKVEKETRWPRFREREAIV